MDIQQLIEYDRHLAPALQDIGKSVYTLAKEMDDQLPDNADKRAGMRKLLEVRDCFMRAELARGKQ